jgi:hypothetical protein
MFKKIIISILLLFGLFSFSNVFWWSWPLYNENNTESIYKDVKNWLETWIKQVKNTVKWIETEESFSEYVQRLVAYFLTFLSVIAVIYIIYAWINIMIAWSDEEKLKDQKKTIIHVIIWIVVIWLAYSLVITVFAWLDNKEIWGSNSWTQYKQNK